MFFAGMAAGKDGFGAFSVVMIVTNLLLMAYLAIVGVK
jgi:hypothetical protein